MNSHLQVIFIIFCWSNKYDSQKNFHLRKQNAKVNCKRLKNIEWTGGHSSHTTSQICINFTMQKASSGENNESSNA